MSIVFTIPMDPKVWDEIAAGILTTAAEGGIGYWADYEVTRFEDGPHKGWVKEIHTFTDAEEGGAFDNAKRSKVNEAGIYMAIKRILDGDVEIASYNKEAIINAIMEKDAGCIDADAADVLVQVALFGEIVFG